MSRERNQDLELFTLSRMGDYQNATDCKGGSSIKQSYDSQRSQPPLASTSSVREKPGPSVIFEVSSLFYNSMFFEEM